MLGIHPKSILQPHQLGAALHAHQHRRHPSAPTLSVQPTNVPGLFSLGPARAAHQAKTVREPRQPKHQSKLSASLPTSAAVTAGVPSATTKPTTPAKSEQQPSSTAATVSTPVSAITPPTTPPPAVHSQDSPKQRGRKPILQSAPKKRSPSPQARRNKNHQPDPTVRPSTPPPSPREQQQQPPASPTRKRPTHQRNNTAPSSPIVATTPAAVTKSAKRRNRRSGAPSPAQQAADKSDDEAGVPIATPVKKDQTRNLSRSVPLESKMPTRAAVAEWDTPAFALASLVSGPRTAPLDKAPRFPFGEGYSPPPSPTPAARHQSVGIFDMDDDLDMVGPASKSVGSSPSVHAARRLNMAGGIFGLSGGVALSASVSTPALLSKSEADRVKFASSSFQFGPSVRALPAPAL